MALPGDPAAPAAPSLTSGAGVELTDDDLDEVIGGLQRAWLPAADTADPGPGPEIG